MIIQISAGQEPAECQLAVAKLFEALKKYPYRQEHKRKNWYVDVSILPDVTEIAAKKEYRMKISLRRKGRPERE